MKSFFRRSHLAAFAGVACTIVWSLALHSQAPEPDTIKAVPILTGSTAYFTRVNGGQYQDVPSVSPLLLAPVGEKWLLEAKGSYSLTFAKGDEGYYENTSAYGLPYAQIDYIANRFVTVTAGRFSTPFGMYGERLAPNWIRALQVSPIIQPVISGSSLGGMLRGGFPVRADKINFDYAAYFSANNTNHIVATQRSSGGRIALFFPAHRLEIGASFQQILEGDHAHSAGVHGEWQPERLPLTLRSEYVRQSGTKGSGYWFESVYRLSQISRLKRLELAARAQQFFADSKLTYAQVKKLGSLGLDTNQADGGVNYYFSRDIRGSASFGRQLAQGKNSNIWVVGITYRFLAPLGPTGGVR
jgi:hypothetical protein